MTPKAEPSSWVFEVVCTAGIYALQPTSGGIVLPLHTAVKFPHRIIPHRIHLSLPSSLQRWRGVDLT